ncbi:MAG: Hsp70 family protein [bacterium]|nr:Hsp70 family protein [bacterium]
MAIKDKSTGDEIASEENTGAGFQENDNLSGGEKPEGFVEKEVSKETVLESTAVKPAQKPVRKSAHAKAARKIKRLDRSVGMEMPSDRYRAFLGTGAIPPVSEKKHFVATLNNLDNLRVTVLEGDSDKASENVLVGEVGLSNITLREDGRAEVEIDFTLDEKGMLSVSLTDRISNTEGYGKFVLPQFMAELTDRIELKGLPVEQMSRKIDLLEQQISVLKGELEVRRVEQ